MASIKLDGLPKELIAHIATFVEALSILNLSRTCRTIGNACWDSLIFKQVLRRSQRLDWRDDSLDLDAIAHRAGNDVSVWARYAVANDKVWVLAGVKDPLESRKRSIGFLPELAVVKHPFLKQPCWFMATHGPFDYLTSHVYCLTMAVLSADERNLSRFHDPGKCEKCFPEPRENDPAFLSGEGSLWTLCSIVITIRDGLKVRRSVWPYNHAANVPFIDFPKAESIPLRPITPEYSLPVPFSHGGKELLNSFRSTPSAWDEWYRKHNHALYTFADLLTEGSWCGYYTYNNQMQLDPPMTNIRFERSRPYEDPNGHEASYVSADECVDGVGRFRIRGALGWDGKYVTFSSTLR